MTCEANLLLAWQWGFEREAQRVDGDGWLATTPHPKVLGEKLTHPRISTDFAEAQLECITGVHATPESAIGELEQLLAFAGDHLDGEYVWPLSAPPPIREPHKIQAADMGPSFDGRLATGYRHGLVHRYGAQMQMVSGVHVNLSLQDVALAQIGEQAGVSDLGQLRERLYLAAARSLVQRAWLLYLLFGSSPRCHESFLSGRQHPYRQFARGDYGAPHNATLRMGNSGYRTDSQDDLWLSYASLKDYIATVAEGLQMPAPGFASPPDMQEMVQLSEYVLQLEAEFYVDVRLKCADPKPYPLRSLAHKGVEYIECRSLDIDPYSVSGINPDYVRFVALLASYGMWRELQGISQPLTENEARQASARSKLVAEQGRNGDLRLPFTDSEAEIGEALQREYTRLAEFCRQADASEEWRTALQPLQQAHHSLADLPSQRMLRDNTPMHELGMQLAARHASALARVPYSLPEMQAEVKASRDAFASLTPLSQQEFAEQLEIYKRERLEGI